MILGDWFLRRAEGVYMEAEAELAEVHPLDWTEQQHAQMQLYLRYKTTAERSFYRAFYAVRGLRKDKLKEELDLAKVRKEMHRCAREVLQQASKELEQEQGEKGRVSGGPVAGSRGRALFKARDQPQKMRKAAASDQGEIQDGTRVRGHPTGRVSDRTATSMSFPKR